MKLEVKAASKGHKQEGDHLVEQEGGTPEPPPPSLPHEKPLTREKGRKNPEAPPLKPVDLAVLAKKDAPTAPKVAPAAPPPPSKESVRERLAAALRGELTRSMSLKKEEPAAAPAPTPIAKPAATSVAPPPAQPVPVSSPATAKPAPPPSAAVAKPVPVGSTPAVTPPPAAVPRPTVATPAATVPVQPPQARPVPAPVVLPTEPTAQSTPTAPAAPAKPVPPSAPTRTAAKPTVTPSGPAAPQAKPAASSPVATTPVPSSTAPSVAAKTTVAAQAAKPQATAGQQTVTEPRPQAKPAPEATKSKVAAPSPPPRMEKKVDAKTPSEAKPSDAGPSEPASVPSSPPKRPIQVRFTGMKPMHVVEAALFSAGKPVSVEEIAETTGLPPDSVKQGIKDLQKDYAARDTVLEVGKAGAKWGMQVKQVAAEPAAKFAPMEIAPKLLKTLALIAYHQPLKQSELVDMIGTKVYDHVPELVERGLVRSREEGVTKILTTTAAFPEYFGLDAAGPEEVRKVMGKLVGIEAPPKKTAEETAASNEAAKAEAAAQPSPDTAAPAPSPADGQASMQ